MTAQRPTLYIVKLWQALSLATPMACCRLAFKALLLTFFVNVALPAGHAEAQTYNEAFGLYIKNDFKGAEKTLVAALKIAKMPGDKMKIYKLLGIVQFMQGRKPQAQAAFKRALAIDPELEINEDEALDESVIPFFKQIAAANKNPATTKKMAVKTPKGTKGAPPAAVTSNENAPKAGPTYGKPINGTKIIIESNVKNAKVSVDGILAGNANTPIEVDPGVREITLQAKGYKTKNAKLKAMKNRESRFTLNLEKPQPPKPKVDPNIKQQQAVADAGVKGSKGAKAKGRKSKGKTDDVVLPGLDKSMFKDETEAALPDDSGGRDLAAEFQYETGAAVQSQGPAPMQPQQPVVIQQPAPGQVVAGQPGYAAAPATTVVVQAPPQVYQPPPVYAQPQAYPPYAAPPPAAAPLPPPAPPAPDYYGDPPDSVTGEDSSGDAGGGNAKSSSKPKSSKKPSLFIALLPGGAGQFQNGDTLLGVAFAAAQGAGFYMYYSGSQDAARNETNYKQYLSEVEAKTRTEDPDYDTAYQNFKKQAASQQQTGMLVMAGAYAASVGQAIYAMPSDTPTKKKKKRRRYGLDLHQETLEPYVLDLKSGESLDFVSLAPYAGPNVDSWHAQFLVTPLPRQATSWPKAEQGDDVGYGILLDYRF